MPIINNQINAHRYSSSQSILNYFHPISHVISATTMLQHHTNSTTHTGISLFSHPQILPNSFPPFLTKPIVVWDNQNMPNTHESGNNRGIGCLLGLITAASSVGFLAIARANTISGTYIPPETLSATASELAIGAYTIAVVCFALDIVFGIAAINTLRNK